MHMTKEYRSLRQRYEAPYLYDIEPLRAPLSILTDASTRSTIDPLEEEEDPNV